MTTEGLTSAEAAARLASARPSRLVAMLIVAAGAVEAVLHVARFGRLW
jgi:hypothetical protein